MKMNKPLRKLVEKYNGIPQFLGMTVTDVNQPGALDDTLLHVVARVGTLEEVSLLLNSGAQVNALGDMGQTPLHVAAIKGRMDVVKRLLEAGGDRHIKDEFDETPAEAAETRGHARIAEYLKHLSVS